jgi:isoamylase
MLDYPILPSATSTKWLGATLNEAKTGTDFVFYAGKGATNVELCLFNEAEGAPESAHFNLTSKEEVREGERVVGYLWHGHAEGVKEGQLYGFRVDGLREQGYNPNKLLVDPAAKAISHDFSWHPNMRGDNNEDDSRQMPKGRVVDWRQLQHEAAKPGSLGPHADTISICEAHVKGATELHASIHENERGKYKALASPEFISWMKHQGITSLELMPIESHDKTYWGYSTLANMAPHIGYASTDRPEREFMEMVRTLKENGIEVIMDVVPNHSIEGNHQGPTANFRGMDPALYAPEDASGCGNTRDFGHPLNARHFIEELKYWRGLGVSGFRIDLASIVGREHSQTFNEQSPVMKAIHEDPELADVKFFGEPWDLKGYFLGDLARIHDLRHNHIAEWNGLSRDLFSEAAFDAHHDMTRGRLINAIAGSHDQYAFHGAGPQMSVAFIESHDHGTLLDLVSSPNGKQNYPNGEDNRDGNEIPRQWYWDRVEDRERVQDFAITNLLLSQSTPMITLGHDRWHSQNGNTNTYNQDNETTWIEWGDKINPKGRELMDLIAAGNRLRSEHASLRRAKFFSGSADEAGDFTFKYGEEYSRLKDVTWLDTDGKELSQEAMGHAGGFGQLISGDPGNSPDEEKSHVRRVQGRPHEDPLLILRNPMRHDIEFTLPDVPGVKWKPAFNSMGYDQEDTPRSGNDKVNVAWRSVMVFEAVRERDITRSM